MRRHPKNQSRVAVFVPTRRGVDTKGLSGDSGRASWWRFQPGYHPIPPPKFDGVCADKLLSSLDCSLIVNAVEISAKLDVAVRPYLISTVMRHVPLPNVRLQYAGIFALDCEAKTSVPERWQTCTSAHKPSTATRIVETSTAPRGLTNPQCGRASFALGSEGRLLDSKSPVDSFKSGSSYLP